MIEEVRRVTCDRCGAQVTTSSVAKELFMSEYTREEAGLSGWELAEGHRHLCPDCAAEYRKLRSRHEAEVRAFLAS